MSLEPSKFARLFLWKSIVDKHKFTGLDSLRGIAAIMVIFQHFWEMNHISDDRLRPWFFYCAGHEAVILFFVMSGFVLSHQLRNFCWQEYPQFILKRIIRIYPPYYLAMILSIVVLLLMSNFYRSSLSGLGLQNWFYIWSQTTFDSTLWRGLITIIGHCGSSLNLSVWTLFYEMWISLLFPFVWYISCLRLKLPKLLLLLIFGIINYYFWSIGLLLENDWSSILYYLWFFIVGMLIYQNLAFCEKFSNIWWWIIALTLYFSNYLFFGKITSRLLHEIIIAAGSSLIIINVIKNNTTKVVLANSVIRFYGRISYSLYLFHLPVLYAITYLYAEKIGLGAVKLVTLVIVTIIAQLNFYFVETRFCNWLKLRIGLR